MQEQNKKVVQPPKSRTQNSAQSLQKESSSQQRPTPQNGPRSQPSTTHIPAGATNTQSQPKEKKILAPSIQKTLLLWGFVIMGVSAVMYVASIVIFSMIIFNAETSLFTTGIIFFVTAFITGIFCLTLLLLAFKDKPSESVHNQEVSKAAKTPVAPPMATNTPQVQPQNTMVAPSQRPMQSKGPEVNTPIKEEKEKTAKKSPKTPKKEKAKVKKAK